MGNEKFNVHACKASPEAIYNEWPEQKGWPWWHSVLLWFKRPYSGLDQVGNKFYRVTAKCLFGKVYIVDAEEWTDNRDLMMNRIFKPRDIEAGEDGGT